MKPKKPKTWIPRYLKGVEEGELMKDVRDYKTLWKKWGRKSSSTKPRLNELFRKRHFDHLDLEFLRKLSTRTSADVHHALFNLRCRTMILSKRRNASPQEQRKYSAPNVVRIVKEEAEKEFGQKFPSDHMPSVRTVQKHIDSYTAWQQREVNGRVMKKELEKADAEMSQEMKDKRIGTKDSFYGGFNGNFSQ